MTGAASTRYGTLELANPYLSNRGGRTAELAPLDLTGEPDIADVLRTFADMLELRVDPRVKLPSRDD